MRKLHYRSKRTNQKIRISFFKPVNIPTVLMKVGKMGTLMHHWLADVDICTNYSGRHFFRKIYQEPFKSEIHL